MTAREALTRTILLARDFIGPQVSDATILHALRAARVAIVADERNLASAAGQTIVVALATMAMQAGASIDLVMPEARLHQQQPPLRGRLLRAGLVALGRDLVPGVRARSRGRPSPGALVFVLGDTKWAGVEANAWRLWSTAWEGGIVPTATDVARVEGTWPLGPLAAATTAAAEPFKTGMRALLEGVGLETAARAQIAAARQSRVRLAPADTPVPARLNIGPVDAISGGAIVSAAVHALLRIPELRVALRVIEPDRLTLSNANRYALFRRSQLGWRKTRALSSWSTPAVEIRGMPRRFEASQLPVLLPLAARVIVGVDDIPSRWLVQQQWPVWLGVGGTVHFTAVCSDHRPGESCAGCFHSTDDGVIADIPTVAFVSYWAGLLLATRLIRDVLGVPYATDEQALELASLRLDEAAAVWPHPIRRTASCPVRCAA